MATGIQRAQTVAILGAGCAGTLLATELCRRRFAGRIVLLDTRTTFQREQRWCFWRKCGQIIGLDLPISAEWRAWQVADSERRIRHTSDTYVYSHVYAPEFFQRFHHRLLEEPSVDLRLGCRVLAIERRGRHAHLIRTTDGEMLADTVFDARHEGTPAYQDATAAAPDLLWQIFRGRVVDLAGSHLDPGTVTLMDFGVRTTGPGLALVYVLPFTQSRVLIEAVVLDGARADAARLDAILDAYMEEHFVGAAGEPLAHEVGVLPMTSRSFAVSGTSTAIGLGVGGGAARPSSGYAFVNIMRAARQIAAAICAGGPLRSPKLAWKYRFLDALFLRLLNVDPAAARRAFMAMFAGTDSDRLVRFLIETSAWQDDLALGYALPKAIFLKTAWSSRPTGKPIIPAELYPSKIAGADQIANQHRTKPEPVARGWTSENL